MYQIFLNTTSVGCNIYIYILWREKERSRIRTVQMENLKGLLGIRRMDIVPNAQIIQLCEVMKGVDEKIDGVLRWFSHLRG